MENDQQVYNNLNTSFLEYLETVENIDDPYYCAKKAFWMEFNNDTKKKFKIARSHFGSYIAVGMASYNLYNMKQKIIKQTIAITRSKNPLVIKAGCAYIGGLYYLGLIAVWHIPSLTIQTAWNLFFATQTATLNYLNPFRPSFEKLLTNEKLIKQTLKEIDQHL